MRTNALGCLIAVNVYRKHKTKRFIPIAFASALAVRGSAPKTEGTISTDLKEAVFNVGTESRAAIVPMNKGAQA